MRLQLRKISQHDQWLARSPAVRSRCSGTAVRSPNPHATLPRPSSDGSHVRACGRHGPRAEGANARKEGADDARHVARRRHHAEEGGHRRRPARVRPLPARRRAADLGQASQRRSIRSSESSSCRATRRRRRISSSASASSTSRSRATTSSRRTARTTTSSAAWPRKDVGLQEKAKKEKATLMVQRDANAKLAVQPVHADRPEVPRLPAHRRGALLPRPQPDGPERGEEGPHRLRQAGEGLPEVALRARRLPGLRRVLLQQQQGPARLAAEGARGVQVRRQLPRELRSTGSPSTSRAGATST